MDNLAIKTNYFEYLRGILKTDDNNSEDDINNNDTATDNN